MEQRGQNLGIVFNRGRETTSYSHLALEAAEFVNQSETFDVAWAFHKRLFKAYFEDLSDIADIEVLIRAAEETGVNAQSLREALTDHRFLPAVEEGITWSRQIGVTAIPTFVFNERMGMVGAQEQPALREMMTRVGNPPREPSAPTD